MPSPATSAPGSRPTSLGPPAATDPALEVTAVGRRWVRRRGDLLRSVSAAAALGLLIGLALLAPAGSSGLGQDVASGWDRVPGLLVGILDVAAVLAVLAAVGSVAVDGLLHRRRALTAAVVAVLVATLLAIVLGAALESLGPTDLRNALLPGPGSSLDSTAGLVAFFTGADLRSRRRWIRLASTALVLAVAAGLALAALGPTSAAAAVLLGWLVGTGTRYAIGVRPAQPTAAVVATALQDTGLAVRRLERVAHQAGLSRYAVELVDGSKLEARVVDRDLRGTGLVGRLWRLAKLRAPAAGHPPLTLRSQVEREALATLAAAAAGVRVRTVRALTVAGSEAFVLVRDDVEARQLRDVPAAGIGPAVLDDAWRQLWLLHTARVAHRSLSGGSVLVTPGQQVVLARFADAEMAAGDVLLRVDVAQLLATLGLVAGAGPAVAALTRGYGAVDRLAIAALLQPIALESGTRQALRTAPNLLAALRSELLADAVAAADSRPASPRPARLERFRVRTVLSVAAATVAGHVLLTQISRANPQQAIGQADLAWAVVAVLGSVTTFVGAAVCLMAFAPVRLPLWRTASVQLGSSFLALVTPPAVGNVALNARYVQRAGLAPTTATATVAMTQGGNLVATIALLVIGGTLTGQTIRRPSLPPTTAVLTVLAACAAVAGLVLTLPWTRRQLVSRLLPQLRSTLPRLLDVLGQPRRLAAGLGGNLLLTGGYVVALDASLRAFHAPLPVAATAVVYLAGSAIGSAAPTPGGLGAVEAALVGGLTAVGTPAAAALPAVLLFRTATFWLPVPPGWVAFTVLQRRGIV